MAAARPEAEAVDDVALSAALRAREPRAASEVARAYGPLVRRVVSRFLGPAVNRQDLAQDLCQEVFLRFFKRIDELRDPAALRGFLISIALGVGAQRGAPRARAALDRAHLLGRPAGDRRPAVLGSRGARGHGAPVRDPRAARAPRIARCSPRASPSRWRSPTSPPRTA